MADFLTALQHFESGGRNIPNTTQGTSSGQAQGFNQITTGTWKEFGGLAYAPTPLQATQEQQNAIAAKIPLRRWAPETLSYLRNQGFTLNPNATLADNIALNHGTLGVASSPHGTTLTSVPTGVVDPSIIAHGGASPPLDASGGTAVAAAPAAPSFGDAAAKGDVGGMLHAALTKPPPTKDAQGNTVEGKSPLQKLAGAVGDVAQKPAPEVAAMQPAMPAQDPDPGLAPAASQLFSTVQQSAARPLSWTSAPYGANAGLIRPGGTTLNATDYGYG